MRSFAKTKHIKIYNLTIPVGNLIAVFHEITFSPLATECMLNLCTSCDISGRERRVATGLTLERCKSICLNDSTCLGIDFGKNSRAGECYFNFEQNINYESHGNFNAWSKSTNCGMYS